MPCNRRSARVKYKKKGISMHKSIISSNGKAASGVSEWANYSINLQQGCEHDCSYCYGKAMALRFGRSTVANWKTPQIRVEALSKVYRQRKGRVMMPTSHDITPANIDQFLSVLMKVLEAGNKVLLVSKPHLPCIKAICKAAKEYRGQILFRFTIGSADDKVLKAWEPGAPSFKERLDSLKWAFKSGYETSISSEPMLDTSIDQVIEKCRPYVTDAIWLGRVNRLRQTLSLNCPGDEKTKAMGEKLLAEQTDDFLMSLYRRYKSDPLIKYKESIKKVVGLVRSTVKGLDI